MLLLDTSVLSLVPDDVTSSPVNVQLNGITTQSRRTLIQSTVEV